MYLSVILPSYNEMSNIKHGVLPGVYSYLKKQSYEWELILSDDGSTDGTTDALLSFAKGKKEVRVVHNAHRGKGPTVISGLLAGTGRWRLFSDFDQATPISEVEKLLDVSKDHDIVIGSREGEGATRKREPFHRHPGISDTQCGFKLFSAQAVETLCPKVVVYRDGARKGAFMGAFDVELLYLASKFGFSIGEVPVQWKYVETKRLDPIKDSIRMFLDLVRIRTTDILGKYK